MSEISYLTQEGLDKLKEELQILKQERFTKFASDIAEASDKGDLSENAEYHAAREAQSLHVLKIAKLEAVLNKAKVLDESKIDASKVAVLSKVKVENILSSDKSEINTYQLVAAQEVDLKQGKISIESPMGKGLLGKKVDDIADIDTPGGKIQVKILTIDR